MKRSIDEARHQIYVEIISRISQYLFRKLQYLWISHGAQHSKQMNQPINNNLSISSSLFPTTLWNFQEFPTDWRRYTLKLIEQKEKFFQRPEIPNDDWSIQQGNNNVVNKIKSKKEKENSNRRKKFHCHKSCPKKTK